MQFIEAIINIICITHYTYQKSLNKINISDI